MPPGPAPNAIPQHGETASHVNLVSSIDRDVDSRELVDVAEVEAGFDDELLALEAGGDEPGVRIPRQVMNKSVVKFCDLHKGKMTYQRSSLSKQWGSWQRRSTT